MRRICSAIVGLMLLAAPAVASDVRQAATAAAEAARALQQQAVQIAASGGRLDMTAAPASENLRRILDTRSFDELPDIRAADMAWLIDWLVAVRTANYTLLYFGADPKQPTRLDPAALARNVKQYEDELARMMVFSQKLVPRALATAQEFMETLPEKERNSKVRLDGLAQMMTGYMESVEGALGFAAADETKVANVRLIACARARRSGSSLRRRTCASASPELSRPRAARPGTRTHQSTCARSRPRWPRPNRKTSPEKDCRTPRSHRVGLARRRGQRAKGNGAIGDGREVLLRKGAVIPRRTIRAEPRASG